MTGSDWMLLTTVLEWLWDHRSGVAALIALALLAGIFNYLYAVAWELYLIRKTLEKHLARREEDDLRN